MEEGRALFAGYKNHRNQYYMLLLCTRRDKMLSEALLKDGRNDLYKLFIDGKIDRLEAKMCDEMEAV